MNSYDLFKAIGNIDDKYITEAELHDVRTDKLHKKYIAAAACFICLIAAASFGIYKYEIPLDDTYKSLALNGSYDYLFPENSDDIGEFMPYNNPADSISSCPFDFSRYFDEQRDDLEKEECIPKLDDFTDFSCIAHYINPSNIYSIDFEWSLDDGKLISATISPDEIKVMNDCVVGNPTPSEVKETVIDGTVIRTEGNSICGYTVTFSHDDTSWFRIESSSGITSEELAGVVDFYWMHGIDFDRFNADRGDTVTHNSYTTEKDASSYTSDNGEFTVIRTDTSGVTGSIPDEFKKYLPDHDSLGMTPVYSDITKRNNTVSHIELGYGYGTSSSEYPVDYYSNGTFKGIMICEVFLSDTAVGDSNINLGDIHDIDRSALDSVLSDKIGKCLGFYDGHFYITISTGFLDSDEVYDVIQSIRNQSA
jgi:hypothetical protein